MKNKFKKLTSLLLASIMMLVALPIQTLAAEWGKGDTVYAAMIGDFVGSDGKAYADKYNYDYIYERYPNEKDYNDELKKIKSIINEQAEENEQ